MADETDATYEALMARLGQFAQALAFSLTEMPLSITLPDGIVYLVRDIRPALIRAYDLIKEEPIPDSVKVSATSAVLYWLSAMDMTMIYSTTGEHFRADAATLHLLAGEIHLYQLIEWAIDPESYNPPTS
ncbi:hypothetical protein [Streptomyces sp. NPDC050738]|uniref:hypothetical protein n=1 Tax=Streptomyces sp. NPDC050738 TaxID=3154744 RepID=UPI00341F7B15